MKAAVYTKYGGPDVLALKEVPKPMPADSEALVKIEATTVSRNDCAFRQPPYAFLKLITGLFGPRKKILGSEFSGEIEAIGKNVTLFKTGDLVFGLTTLQFGTHAEYICIDEKKSFVHKPKNMSHEQAASVCDGMMLGMNFVKNIKSTGSKKILINGATGSIGSACVQLAKYFGAEITAVCNTKNLALIKSLGANEVIDYTQEDFTKRPGQYDYIFDAVGKSSFLKCKHLLKPKGVYISSELGYMLQNIYLPILTFLTGGKRVKFPIPTDSKKDILFFKELIESGKYRAVIDKIYKLENIVAATRYVETGEKTGNVVITID